MEKLTVIADEVCVKNNNNNNNKALLTSLTCHHASSRKRPLKAIKLNNQPYLFHSIPLTVFQPACVFLSSATVYY